MASTQIARYSLAWHSKANSGLIILELDGGRRHKITYESSAEFCAVATVLRESPVFVRHDGVIHTGAEIAED